MGLSLLSLYSAEGKEEKLQATMVLGRAVPGISRGVGWTGPLGIGDAGLHADIQKSI